MDYKTFDFAQSELLSKDEIKAINLLQESFCRSLETGLYTFVRTVLQVSIDTVEQLPYSHYIASTSQPSFLVVFSVKPLEGRSVLELSLNLVFTIVDRLLGGNGSSKITDREPTDIEKKIIERVAIRILESLKESWVQAVNMQPKIEAKETNPNFVQIASPSENVVLIRLKVVIGDITGYITVVFPAVSLEPVLPNIGSQQWLKDSEKIKDPTDISAVLLRKNIDEVKTYLKANVLDARLTLKEFLKLKEGDILKLNPESFQHIQVKINNKTKYSGFLGVIGNKKAIKITQMKAG